MRELTIRGSWASAGQFSVCLDLVVQGRTQAKPFHQPAHAAFRGPARLDMLPAGDRTLLKVVLRPQGRACLLIKAAIVRKLQAGRLRTATWWRAGLSVV